MNRVDAFDPDAFVPKAVPQPLVYLPVAPPMPTEWAVGMSQLERMPPPRGATQERWAQIVQDATRLAWWRHEMATSARWTTGALFGFDPSDPEAPCGLALHLRGGRVIHIDEREAWVQNGPSMRFLKREPLDAMPPIWLAR